MVVVFVVVELAAALVVAVVTRAVVVEPIAPVVAKGAVVNRTVVVEPPAELAGLVVEIGTVVARAVVAVARDLTEFIQSRFRTKLIMKIFFKRNILNCF